MLTREQQKLLWSQRHIAQARLTYYTKQRRSAWARYRTQDVDTVRRYIATLDRLITQHTALILALSDEITDASIEPARVQRSTPQTTH